MKNENIRTMVVTKEEVNREVKREVKRAVIMTVIWAILCICFALYAGYKIGLRGSL